MKKLRQTVCIREWLALQPDTQTQDDNRTKETYKPKTYLTSDWTLPRASEETEQNINEL